MNDWQGSECPWPILWPPRILEKWPSWDDNYRVVARIIKDQDKDYMGAIINRQDGNIAKSCHLACQNYNI